MGPIRNSHHAIPFRETSMELTSSADELRYEWEIYGLEQQIEFQNNWKNRLVDPSPNDRKSAGLTKALHKGQVLSLSNLQTKVIWIHQKMLLRGASTCYWGYKSHTENWEPCTHKIQYPRLVNIWDVRRE